MTVASDVLLRQMFDDGHPVVQPFHEQTKEFGMTYGLGPAGYDIRIAQDLVVPPGEFVLGSSLERFKIPDYMVAIVHDKSTWARQGLAVQNTVAEPGWEGYLTLELTNHKRILTPLEEDFLWPYNQIYLKKGMPIAQVIFHLLDRSTSIPYKGKYQSQAEGPQLAILE